MNNDRRHTLKQLISGTISAREAAQQLESHKHYHDAILIGLKSADGLYSVGSDTGLSYDEMAKRLTKDVHILMKHDSLLLDRFEPVGTLGYYRCKTDAQH